MDKFEDDENLVKSCVVPSLKEALHCSCSVFEQFSLHETTEYQRENFARTEYQRKESRKETNNQEQAIF